MTGLLPFGPGAWLLIVVYLLSLLLIGWIGYRARKENTLRDFYLAGSSFGVVVLLFTFYATQYSGNTLFGFTGNTYRLGYTWILCLHFMIAVVVCYLLYAPQMYARARRHGYITPADFLHERFRSEGLSLLAVVLMVYALGNFLLAQLMAMGRAMQGMAVEQPELAYQLGVTVLALIMVIYGTLGGLRAIAWTDAIQGMVLFVGFIILFFIMFDHYGPLPEATRLILESADPQQRAKVLPPDADMQRQWLSYIILVGLGVALYPQAMQRIFAARSERSLRMSLAIMAFLPLTTVLVAVIAGIYAIAYIPGLEGAASDQILTRILAEVQQGSLFGYWLVAIMFAAILAALMSTADSLLLSISSMLTKDVYGRYLRPEAGEAELTRVGKSCSWLLVIALVSLAIVLRESTSLVDLLDRKLDLMAQLVPAFILGLRWTGLRTGPTFLGMAAGVTVALWLAYTTDGRLAGFHPGLYGLAVNMAIAVCGSWWPNRYAARHS
jgi:solute:Na+ symporter, SSS family